MSLHRKKLEKGENKMNRKFLEELGLEKETIDKVMAEHGKAIQEVKPADDYEELQTQNKTLAQQVEELNGTLTATNEKYADYDQQLEEATKELEASKVKNTKFRIANEKGIPLELAGRLSGSTEEEILEDAEKLSNFVGKRTALPLGSTEPSDVNNEDAAYSKMLEDLK